MGPVGRGAAATYIALLKQVGVIPAVVEQPLPCVPHVTVQAEVDVGIRSRTYQNYEYGGRTPPLETLIALANLYDISLDELVCRERH